METEATCGAAAFTNTKLATGTLLAPFDGVIVRWRMEIATPGGSYGYKLRVLRPLGGNSYEGISTGSGQLAPSSGVNVMALSEPIPIKAGDLIGIDCPTGAPSPASVEAPSGSVYAYFNSLPDGKTSTPGNQLPTDEVLGAT